MTNKWKDVVENDCANGGLGKTQPGKLGVNFSALPRDVQQRLETNKGLYVVSVLPDSPAFDSNVLVGDIVTAVNGKPVNSLNDGEILRSEIRLSCESKSPLLLSITRENNTKRKVSAMICK
jgi:S1-C subfamily serine protease